MSRNPRIEQLAWILPAVYVVLSRALAAPDILSEWDSANYVHGWRAFDVYEHAPHAPGYPLFVLALALLTVLPGPVTVPFLVLNVALSLGVLAMLGWIARAEAGRGVALAVAAAFAVCPAFWFHGSMSTAYVAECFCSTLVAFGAWGLIRRHLAVVLAAVLLAIAGGIRPSALLYLTPLMVLGMIASRQAWQRWLLFAGTAAAGVLAWLVPTVVLSGGWSRYNTTSKALAAWQSTTDSVLSGSFAEAGENAQHLLLYLGDSLNLLLVLLAFCVVLCLLRRRWGWLWPLFVLTWCLPAALLYVLHHLPKAGYALTLLPGLFLGAGLAFAAAQAASTARARKIQAGVALGWLALVVLVNVSAFVLAVPAEALDEDDPAFAASAPVVVTGDYGWRGIRWRTEPQRQHRALVAEHGGEGTAELFLWGTHELQRIESVYAPDQWMLTEALDHGCIHNNRDASDAYCGTFGDLQVRILYPPEGGLTHREPTVVELVGGRLSVQRAGRYVGVDLDPPPSRLLVLVPCPPCSVVVGRGLHEVDLLRVGAGNRMMVLEVEADAPAPPPRPTDGDAP